MMKVGWRISVCLVETNEKSWVFPSRSYSAWIGACNAYLGACYWRRGINMMRVWELYRKKNRELFMLLGIKNNIRFRMFSDMEVMHDSSLGWMCYCEAEGNKFWICLTFTRVCCMYMRQCMCGGSLISVSFQFVSGGSEGEENWINFCSLSSLFDGMRWKYFTDWFDGKLCFFRE